jgi:hypothetical protein
VGPAAQPRPEIVDHRPDISPGRDQGLEGCFGGFVSQEAGSPDVDGTEPLQASWPGVLVERPAGRPLGRVGRGTWVPGPRRPRIAAPARPSRGGPSAAGIGRPVRS